MAVVAGGVLVFLLVALSTCRWLAPCSRFIPCCSSLAFRSDDAIRADLLDEVPIGSPVVEVERLAARRGFQLREGGSLMEWDQRLPIDPLSVSLVSAHLGTYYWFWRTDVVAYWILDEDDLVRDVAVSRFLDAP